MQAQPLPFTLTLTNEALTVVVDGAPRVLRQGTAQYAAVRAAVVKDPPDWEAAHRGLTKDGAVLAWLSQGGADPLLADFAVDEFGALAFRGEKIPPEFGERAAQMAAAGEDPSPLLKFFARLQKNPSKRSVDQLYPFLKHCSIPIEQDGTFLAYKGVNQDLTDKHTGTIDNTPGTVVKMERNKISDDPCEACHEGLHVGALRYAKDFVSYNGRLVVCRVKPEDVVSIPYDSDAEKMRVCEYEVVGHYAEPLPSTTVKSGDLDVEEHEDSYSRHEDEAPAAKVAAPKKRKLPRGLGRKPPRELLKQTINDLRAYAAKLKIVGATKLPGGKVRLVKEIVKARRK